MTQEDMLESFAHAITDHAAMGEFSTTHNGVMWGCSHPVTGLWDHFELRAADDRTLREFLNRAKEAGYALNSRGKTRAGLQWLLTVYNLALNREIRTESNRSYCAPGILDAMCRGDQHEADRLKALGWSAQIPNIALASCQAINVLLARGDNDPPDDPPRKQEKPKKKRGGRKRDPKRQKEDAEIAEKWESGKYHTKAELDVELKLSRGTVYAALERHRKRKPARKN